VKLAFSQARALLLGVALIVVTNAVVLAGVAYNRSGDPEAVLKLTERELRIRSWTWPENENSSIDLHLSWRVASRETDEDGYDWYRGLHWLQPAQLRELGFDVVDDVESEEGQERVRRQPSRRAWLVLEFDGPAYQTELTLARQRAERAATLAQVNAGDSEFQDRLNAARSEVTREERSETRLFAVDAGRDAAALRKRYPDRQRYAIVNGHLDVAVDGPPRQRRMIAHITEIDVGAIRVPHTYRAIIEPLISTYYPSREPRFTATVDFGQRFEPWIVELVSLQ
jgi:hypothetical protein